MKREIKFRAWCQLHDVMIYDYCKLDDNQFEGYDLTNNNHHIASVMQYTGLKDKNGVEIYERDIIRILYTDWLSNTDPNISLEDYLISISHVGEVIYQAPEFGILFFKEDRYGERPIGTFNHGTHGRMEVIGNIYEHHQLLNP